MSSTPMLSRRRFLQGVGLGAAALWLPGCRADTAGPAPTPTAGGPVRGGELTFVSRYVLPGGLNHLTNPDPGLPGFTCLCYNRLLEFEQGPDTDGLEIVPDLAESWEISPDGLEYTFRLRRDVVWHDIPPVNGRPLTSADVAATFRATIDLPAPHAGQFRAVTDIATPDDHTVVFTLSEPYAPLLEFFALYQNAILPVEGVEGDYDLETTVIGTGPFMLEDFDREVEWLYERNPSYFLGEDRPYLDRYRQVIITDPNTRHSALVGGRVNFSIFSDYERAVELADSGDFGMLSYASGHQRLHINLRNERFQDLRFRRAVAMAVDWTGMADTVRGRAEVCALIPGSTGAEGLDPDELLQLRPYDPDEAGRLLEASDFDGGPIQLLVQQLDENDVREAAWIQQDLQEIGITVELETVDAGTAAARLMEGQFEFARQQRALVTSEQYLSDFDEGSITNYPGIDDARSQELIDASRVEMDLERRREIIRDWQRHMETEIVASISSPLLYDTMVFPANVHTSYTSSRGISPIVLRATDMWANTWIDET